MRCVVVQSLSHVRLCDPRLFAALQAPLSSTVSRVCWSSYPLSRWCHPIISFSVSPFFSFSQSSQHQGLLHWVGSSVQVAKELKLQYQFFQWIFRVYFLLELTGLVSLLSKELSGVFSSTTLQKNLFFSSHPSLWSNSHIYTWLLEKP